MYAAAVTGTNGKTSTTEFARQLLARKPARAVSVGSLGTTDRKGTSATPFFLSRPGCWRDHLAELAFEYEAAVLEAFSGGLSAGEWDGVELDAGVLTTFGQDHLDLHGTRQAYAEAKLRLFRAGVTSGGTAVLNRDCELYEDAVAIARARGLTVLTYGSEGDVALRRLQPAEGDWGATVQAFGACYEVTVSVPTDFLVENALAALCVAVAGGGDPFRLLDGLGSLKTPRGRMEHAASIRGADIFVDFAHTPDALEAVLRSARRTAPERVVVVFGCGGKRDPGKRREMGRVAGRLADVVIVTDDNPRSEDARAIRSQVLRGCPRAEEIPDRIAAIQAAVERAAPGDVVLICGRGSERYQDLGSRKRVCDDVQVVRRTILS